MLSAVWLMIWHELPFQLIEEKLLLKGFLPLHRVTDIVTIGSVFCILHIDSI